MRAVLTAILFCVLAAAALGAKRKDEVELPKPPPQPVPQQVTVARGRKVEITLRVYERLPPNVQYVIRTKPDWGKLSAPKQAAANTATVVFEPPDDLTIKADKFLYASKTPAGVSAAAEVLIRITDEPAKLTIPDELKFEPIRAGQSERQQMTIRNDGGSLAEGELEVDPPWKLLEHRSYSLGKGEEKTFTVIFAPVTGGTFKREIRYTSHRSRVTTLIGEAIFPLSLAPPRLELTREPNQTARSGAVEIRNTSDETQRLTLRGSSRFKAPASVEVPANSSAPLILSLPPDDLQPVKETVKLTGEGIELELPVEAARVPAVLSVEAKSGRAAGSVPGRIPVRNLGGANGYWEIVAEPPFVPAAKELRLGAREDGSVLVHLEPSAGPGRYSGTLRFVGEHQTLSVALEGEMTPPAAPPVSNAPRTSAAPPKPAPAAAGSESRVAAEPERATERRRPRAEAVRRSDPSTLTGIPVPIIKDGVVTFEWPAALHEGQPVKAEVRRLSADEKKKLRTEWLDLRDARFSAVDGKTRAEVRGLPAGQLSVVRFVTYEAGTGAPRPLFQMPVTIPARERSSLLNKWFFLTMGALAGVGGLVYLRLKRR